jgi:hypothetical protein
MWEHAGALVGIPAAIKATIEILGYIRSGSSPTDRATTDAAAKLSIVQSGLEGFAQDALELAAFKRLHTMTNQFGIDLRETFAMIGPDEKRAQHHHIEMLEVIEREFLTLWDGERAGNQLARLKDTPKLMQFLAVLPSDVSEKIPNPPWEAYFWTLLRETQGECRNFKNFYSQVHRLRMLNAALNNYADRRIAAGIDEFDAIMDQLRVALARA